MHTSHMHRACTLCTIYFLFLFFLFKPDGGVSRRVLTTAEHLTLPFLFLFFVTGRRWFKARAADY
ncbi:hypothetical protein T492DRAFT_1035227 [Pavlovales sp. CCMP2436]|nr:hypothetical protein T492DRAFT_1035227 [Pavlovales sp. CCMP2436]